MTQEDKEPKTYTILYSDGKMIVPDKIPIDMMKKFFVKFLGTPTKKEYLKWKEENEIK
jgi:hypothetical protein